MTRSKKQQESLPQVNIKDLAPETVEAIRAEALRNGVGPSLSVQIRWALTQFAKSVQSAHKDN